MRRLILTSVIALAAASCLPPLRTPATIRAMVLSADASSNELILDKGRTDGVRKGMVFVIRFATGGQSTPNAKVTQVEPTRCYTTYPGVRRTPVQIGDEAIQVR